jgi:hypothetical protein
MTRAWKGTAAALLLWPALAGAETVVLERDVVLRTEPSLSAPAGIALKQGARAELVDKRSVWLNVKTAEGAGWVFVFNVRYGERQSTGQGDAAAAARLGRQPVNVTSTIGIRGLSEEDLQKAAYNANEMAALDGYAASKDAAEQQAARAGLQPVRVDYFEERK